jgi:hypothetical protein
MLRFKHDVGRRFDPSSIKKGDGVSSILAIVVVVIIIAAAIGGAYAYYYVANSPKASNSFTFGLEGSDATHVTIIDALNHTSQYGITAKTLVISDPTSLTSAGADDKVNIFEFQFPTTTINAIEAGANLVAIGEDSTSFLQDFVVSSSITNFAQTNGTTMAAFSLDGPVIFPLVYGAYGYNYSQFNINLVVIGDSPVKAQGLIAGKYQGAFLDPQDAATVMAAVPGKFHILGTTASAFPGIGGGVLFANKDWLKNTNNFNMAVDLEVALLQSARNATQNLSTWVQRTYNAYFKSELNFSTYNSTEYILNQADFYSPNMITYTPSLMNASNQFLAAGGLINSTGNVNTMYNFTVLQSALKKIGTVPEPPGPYSNSSAYPPLSTSLAIYGKVAGDVGVGTMLAIPTSTYSFRKDSA